jgi:phytanoyl-CoA hydroxylase
MGKMGRTELGCDYERDGFATLGEVIDNSTTLLMREHLDLCRIEQGLTLDAGIIVAALADNIANTVAWGQQLVSIASQLLDAPAAVFGITYLCKPAKTGLPALWHQDGAPWAGRLGGSPALTIWIALDDTNASNGCLRVIPGSHRRAAEPLRPNVLAASMFGVEMDAALVDEGDAIELPLESGQGSVHHPNLIHGSGSNRSTHSRRALAIRYQGLM